MALKYYNDISGAPKAIGPYSQACGAGNIVFLSGQVPLDPDSGELVAGGIESQAQRVFANLEAVLSGVGASTTDILKATIFLTDLSNFAVVNELYQQWLGESRPARATVEVAGLPLGAEIEIELIVRVNS